MNFERFRLRKGMFQCVPDTEPHPELALLKEGLEGKIPCNYDPANDEDIMNFKYNKCECNYRRKTVPPLKEIRRELDQAYFEAKVERFILEYEARWHRRQKCTIHLSYLDICGMTMRKEEVFVLHHNFDIVIEGDHLNPNSKRMVKRCQCLTPRSCPKKAMRVPHKIRKKSTQ